MSNAFQTSFRFVTKKNLSRWKLDIGGRWVGSRFQALAVSDLLEVPVKYELRQDELERLKNHLQGSHQEALATVIAQAALIKSPGVGVPSSFKGLSAMPPTPTMNADVAEADQDTAGSKPVSASNPVKMPIDSYAWRKYGQKQVKSPEGSRSYYKCAYSSCDAKKLESFDQFNSVIKVVYKGQHKHDPPKRVILKEGKILSTPKSLKRKSISSPIEVEQIDNSAIKQRLKRNSSESPVSVPKHPKKPKFIVHAAADMEISADGYRWRKYGQKKVKGNPHPRNYYKCTSAGCTVKKHIEKVIDGSSEVIITYKGVHNHDTPVPKRGRGPPRGLLITAASKIISQSKKSGYSSTQVSTTEAAKPNESARTLLSVGFEIKRC
ncbi:hypothetical protein L1987_77826 [Smallanthus sonchifolius]|uniref:Uncharacterized protein n=1 Tax=Smallanthus sonchifolius TaxID=185202 RepID=A0ACB8ZC22_9ASTR|nr:hypothetical protein L1987_77826 [Smallanthus sonchifolius]